MAIEAVTAKERQCGETGREICEFAIKEGLVTESPSKGRPYEIQKSRVTKSTNRAR